jgi:hypothetical protein
MLPPYLVRSKDALRTTEIEELPHPGGLPPAACFAAFSGVKTQAML